MSTTVKGLAILFSVLCLIVSPSCKEEEKKESKKKNDNATPAATGGLPDTTGGGSPGGLEDECDRLLGSGGSGRDDDERDRDRDDDDGFGLIEESRLNLQSSDPTWDDDIERIFDRYCISCHSPDDDYGDLSTHRAASDLARKIETRVGNDSMPPRDSRQLSSSDKRKILDWVDAGTPRDDRDGGGRDRDEDEDEEDRDRLRDECERRRDGGDRDDGGDDRRGGGGSSDADWEDLLNPRKLRDCKDDDRIYDRAARKCHIAKIADWDCSRSGVVDAFRKVGVNVRDNVEDVMDDGYEIDQCGEYKDEPIVYFIKKQERDDELGLKIKRLCRRGTDVCDHRSSGGGDDGDDDGGRDGDDLDEGPGTFRMDFKDSSRFFRATKSKLATTKHPGGKNAHIYYSKNIRSAVGKRRFNAPDGTVAIKDFEDGDGNRVITVMIKEDGRWVYNKRDEYGTVDGPDGSPMIGRLKGCIDCHSRADDTDYLPYLPDATDD